MKKIIIILFCSLSLLFAREAKTIISSVCYGCHGDKMELSCYGVSKIANTLSEEYIKSALLQYKSGSKSDYGLGDIMLSQIGGLSNKEIEALALYIPTLK